MLLKSLTCLLVLFVFIGNSVSSFSQISMLRKENEHDNIDVESIAFNSSGDIFVAAGDSGVYRSIDNGEHWTRVTAPGYPFIFMRGIAVNSQDEIFAANGLVFRSTDNGESWTNAFNGLPTESSSIYCFAINSGDHIFIGREGGIFRSTNNGDGWTEINNGLNYINAVLSIAFNPSSHIYIGGAGLGPNGPVRGIFRSTDNGDSWVEVNNQVQPYSLAIGADGHVFAGTHQTGLFRSIDNGATWQNVGFPNNSIGPIVINNSGVIFVGALGVSRSTNGGEEWEQINAGLSNTNVKSLAINSDGAIYAGTTNGIFRSNDNGSNWIQIGLVTSVKQKPVANFSFLLKQNYPNPFNPETIIEYEIRKPGHVTLSIYNVLGQLILNLVNEWQPAGTYRINWNGQQQTNNIKLNTGLYLYELKFKKKQLDVKCF